MPPLGEFGKIVGPLLLLLAVESIHLGLWYRKTYKPGMVAAEALGRLSVSLQAADSRWQPSGKVSVHGIWKPWAFKTNDSVMIAVEGTWDGTAAMIRLVLDVGYPDDSFWGKGGDSTSAYQPPTTVLRLAVRRSSAAPVKITKWDKSSVSWNRPVAFLGLAPKLKQVSGDLYSYWDDAEIARYFRPSVLALARVFPHPLFEMGTTYPGLIVEGSETRIQWNGHESDPTVVAAGFRLLKAISDGTD